MSAYPNDIAVIGSGPAGYICALRAAQLGLRAVVVEKESLGGVCLNIGCIPSKALLRNAEVIHTLRTGGKTFGFQCGPVTADYTAAVKRSRQTANRLVKGVELLLRKNGVDVISGTATIPEHGTVEVKSPEGSRRISARNIVIATGARPITPPGLSPDGLRILTYREAILQETLPASAVIVGAGPIGLEFATIWSAYGVPVTLVEMLPRIAPLEDEEVSAELAKAFEKRGVRIRTGSRVQKIEAEDSETRVTLESPDGGETLAAGQVLLATGFRPNSEQLGLEALGVQLDNGSVVIDDTYQTTADGIWAVGDVTGKLMLAHVGSAMGLRCAERIAGREPEPLSYEFMPRGIYSQPQAASFGLTESQAAERGLSFHTAKFPFQANGKALGLGEYAGWVKLIASQPDGQLIGAHMVGPEVTELLPELSLAHLAGLPVEKIARNIHAHPTLAEAVMEAAHGLTDGFLHL